MEDVFARIKPDSTYEDIQSVARTTYNDFVAEHKDDPGYTESKHGIEFGVYLHEIVDGKPLYVQFAYRDNFKINQQGPKEAEVFGVAAHSDIALPLFVRKINSGLPIEKAARRTFEHVADEIVGGYLTMFVVQAEGIVASKCVIRDRKPLPKFRDLTIPYNATMDGSVVARKITLTGQIDNSSMYSSDITGGTITGALIRTSASGARVEVDARGWRTYDQSGHERISINANDTYGMSAISFAKSDGSGAGTLNGSDAAFQVYSFADMLIAAVGGGTVYIGNQGGRVDFSGANVAGLTPTSVTGLSALLSGKADKGASTTPVSGGAHNHGFPDGTQFKSVDGKIYTWSAYGGFTHQHSI
ncbi:hypothetical protein [Paenibacillus sp. J22TS3]|uniref:hypothetical protein n=1 Tax=Paenibacillus sp. J22TS3 TaxID=2807192 RepID=UPI001BD19A3D|nr:hypothetical protein [Paenibacillus sp. J22TS3]